MNTYANTIQRITRNNRSRNTAILTIILALVTVAVIVIYVTDRSVVGAASHSSVAYSNALEMQYAQPWLVAHNKPVVAYSNALEMEYAQPWLDTQNKPVVVYSNALEMQYAQPWLDKSNKQNPLNCDSSSPEIFYACKYGYGSP